MNETIVAWSGKTRAGTFLAGLLILVCGSATFFSFDRKSDLRAAPAPKNAPAASDRALDPHSDMGRSRSQVIPWSAGNAIQMVERGKELFAKQCAVCHGDSGDGAGKFAYLMNPRPRNLQQGKFKIASTENQIPTQEDLIRTISRGMPGSAMPPWGHLPLSDLQSLAAYVRLILVQGVQTQAGTLAQNGELTPEEVDSYVLARVKPGKPLTIPPEPTLDDVRWFNGRRIYLEGVRQLSRRGRASGSGCREVRCGRIPGSPAQFCQRSVQGRQRGAPTLHPHRERRQRHAHARIGGQLFR
jgi:mono/diheme cytochrome c family protein